jgi:hypothetical protein
VNAARDSARELLRAGVALRPPASRPSPNALRRARERLSALIARGEALQAGARSGAAPDDAAVGALRLNAATIVGQLAENEPQYRLACERLVRERSASPERSLEAVIGVLVGLREDLDGGHLGSLRERIRSQLLVELLDRADDWRARGFFDVAVVIAGEVARAHLVQLCAHHGLSARATGLRGLGADLARVGALGADELERLRSWDELIDRAAHRGGVAKADAAELARHVARFVDDHQGALPHFAEPTDPGTAGEP